MVISVSAHFQLMSKSAQNKQFACQLGNKGLFSLGNFNERRWQQALEKQHQEENGKEQSRRQAFSIVALIGQLLTSQ